MEFVQELEKGEEAASGIFPDPGLSIRCRDGYNYAHLRMHGSTGGNLVGPSHRLVGISRWPESTGRRKLLYSILRFLEDPSLTISRMRLLQLYDPAKRESNERMKKPRKRDGREIALVHVSRISQQYELDQ